MVLVRRLAGCVLVAALAQGTASAQKKTPSYYGPQPTVENIDLTMYARIREEGLRHSHVMEFAGALADGIGRALPDRRTWPKPTPGPTTP